MDGPSRRPTDSSRSEGTPSLSEGPSGGAETFWLLLGRLPKVTRCKSGTISRRYRSNGYVHPSPPPSPLHGHRKPRIPKRMTTRIKKPQLHIHPLKQRRKTPLLLLNKPRTAPKHRNRQHRDLRLSNRLHQMHILRAEVMPEDAQR